MIFLCIKLGVTTSATGPHCSYTNLQINFWDKERGRQLVYSFHPARATFTNYFKRFYGFKKLINFPSREINNVESDDEFNYEHAINRFDR